MNAELVIQRFNILPENLQFQVSEYIEFLINRYKSTSLIESKKIKEDEDLTPEIKKMLDERIFNYEKNPKKAKSWEEVEQQLMKK